VRVQTAACDGGWERRAGGGGEVVADVTVGVRDLGLRAGNEPHPGDHEFIGRCVSS